MAPSVNNYSDIDVSAISFNDPRMLDNGSKSIYFNHKKTALYLQTPVSRAPFGINDWEGEKFSINISIADKGFLEKIQELDTRIIDEAYAKSQSWFKQKFASRDVLAELYTSPIHWSKDKVTGEINTNYEPTFKFNVPYKDKEFKCEGYTKNVATGEVKPLAISKETIHKGANIQAILQCSGIWIAGKKFGCTFRLSQLLKLDDDSAPRKITGYAFIEDSDEE